MTRLRASQIVNDAGLMLIAIEAVDFQQNKTTSSCRCHGNIEPLALIVCSPAGINALDMEAKHITLDQLVQNIPKLDAMIAAFNKT